MPGSLVVVTGVGTEVGKTHLACTLLVAARHAGLRVAGYKPVESGVGDAPTDQDRLDAAAPFHVKRPRPRLALRAAVSPHLAARREGVQVSLQPEVDWAHTVRQEVDVLVVELAGGLFSPLSDTERNIDLLSRLDPTHTVLVAPDRLGVLHDVEAVRRAAPGISLAAVVLMAPATPDTSTGSNADELARLGHEGHIVPLGRGTPDELASAAGAAELYRILGW